MAKNTETFLLIYKIPTQHHSKSLSSNYIDIKTSKPKRLLITGDVVERALTENEKEMPIHLFDTYLGKGERIDGLERNKRYLSKTFEVAKNPENPEQRKIKSTVDYISKHYEVSFKGYHADDFRLGAELNKNVGSTTRYYLINLDARDNELAEREEMIANLVHELSTIKNSSVEEFNNLAFGFGVNPFNLTLQATFNSIVSIIKDNPTRFSDFLHNDTDKYVKIVLNKALRVAKPSSNDTYVVENNGCYYINGELIASNYDTAIGYLKENKEMMEFFEHELGFKKKSNLKASAKA